MITNFEDLTKGLTINETTLILPRVIEMVKWRKGKENAVTNNKMINLLTAMGYNVTQPRIRKIINQIRMNGLVKNLLATSKGYYVSGDKKEINRYVLSLRERAASINAIADALK